MQLNIFELMRERYKITKPIRLIELFAGIGSQAKALSNLRVDFEHYRICEFDKYAVASYNAIHNTNFETSDITQINAKELGIVETDKYEYILTYSFPCVDISICGKMKGFDKGSNTRSSLLWEVERLLDECTELPQILLMENVPKVIGTNNVKNFNLWQKKLESLGYSNYHQILNAKDYGIPQNRDRCFMVSILGNYSYTFPEKVKLELRLKDMLEDEVDEKYYLSDKMIKCFASNGTGKYPRGERFIQNINRPNQEIANSITTLAGNRATDNFILIPKKDTKNYVEWEEKGKFDVDCRAWKIDKISPTIVTSDKTKILIPEATKKGYAEATEGDGVYINRPHQKRGVVQKGMIQTIKTSCDDIGVVVKGNYSPSGHNASRIVDINGLAPTVMENHGTVTAIEEKLRIRKLTPKECWRLMGFTDEDFDKASKVNSNAQLYKQAGNSIVVNVLEAIFKQLL